MASVNHQVYLEVKAGSLHETDQQQGIAHFVEHVSALAWPLPVTRTPIRCSAPRAYSPTPILRLYGPTSRGHPRAPRVRVRVAGLGLGLGLTQVIHGTDRTIESPRGVGANVWTEPPLCCSNPNPTGRRGVAQFSSHPSEICPGQQTPRNLSLRRP